MSFDAFISIFINTCFNFLFPILWYTCMFPHECAHTQTNTSIFVPGRKAIKRPTARLNPWPLIPGGLPLPMLEVQGGETEGWRGEKRRGCGGALKTAPSVRPAQAASWVSSPSSVQWPLSCSHVFFFLLPLKNKLSFSVQMAINLAWDMWYETSAFV